MADALPTSNYYQNLGGINLKASQYEMSTAQFLDLRNLDFDVPKALQKRPGSTLAVTAGTSGPIQTLFEFVKLTGESYMVAASDTALFYITSQQYTLLSPGWNNGQPPDMLTFVNKMWVANGQSWLSWSGNSGVPVPVGLPSSLATPYAFSGYTAQYLHYAQPGAATGGSFFYVGGVTFISKGSTKVIKSVYAAYSYIRSDGYQGPADFLATARNVVRNSPGNANEFFSASSGADVFWNQLGGFTIPTGYGISGIALWFAVDTIVVGPASLETAENIPGVGLAVTGDLGWYDGSFATAQTGFGSYSLKPNADLSKFWLYTIIPGASLFLSSDSGQTYYASTFYVGASSFSLFDAVADLSRAYSGMPTNFFASYIPKYIEVNQNIMFSAGFSSAPSTVFFSEVGEPENVQPDSFFELRTNDGDKITGLQSFNSQVVITKEKSFGKLIGDSADNFQLIDLSSDYGCLSQRTFLTKDQTLYWLDRKGIVQFSGANWSIVSDAIDPIFRRMNLSAAKEKAVGVHHIYRNQFWWGIPIDGSSVNNLTVVYDYLVGAWTFFDGFNAASFTFAKQQLSSPTVWRGDYSGLVHYTGSSFFSDSGQGITCLALTRFDQEGGENQTTLWRRLFLDTAVSTGATGQIRGQVFANFDTSTIQATFQTAQTAFQSRIEMGVPAKAVAAQFSHFSASLPLLVNGYGWAKRGLRNV